MTHQTAETPQHKESDFLDIMQVAREIGKASRETVRRLMINDPTFPRGTKVEGLRGNVWVYGDIEAWKAAKTAKARAENAERLSVLRPKQGVRRGK
jgi:predicted DNA-binding transcriptional regulator AlpA